MKYESQKKYDDKNCKRYTFKLNKNNENDKIIIEFLDSEDLLEMFSSKNDFFRKVASTYIKFIKIYYDRCKEK